MARPEKVNLKCKHCGHTWLEPVSIFLAQDEIIYRGDEKTVKRRVDCPNCDRGVLVDVPKAWFDNE